LRGLTRTLSRGLLIWNIIHIEIKRDAWGTIRGNSKRHIHIEACSTWRLIPSPPAYWSTIGDTDKEMVYIYLGSDPETMAWNMLFYPYSCGLEKLRRSKAR
jgi:hypothetical protein